MTKERTLLLVRKWEAARSPVSKSPCLDSSKGDFVGISRTCFCSVQSYSGRGAAGEGGLFGVFFVCFLFFSLDISYIQMVQFQHVSYKRMFRVYLRAREGPTIKDLL